MTITKHQRMTESEREKLGATLEKEYATGKHSLAALGEKHGTTAGRVRLILLERGVTLRTRGGAVRKPDPARPGLAKKVAKTYDKGSSLTDLAEEFGISATTARTLAQEGGATMRSRGGRKATAKAA